MASTSTACLRLPILRARTRSAAGSSSSSSTRRPHASSLKCSSAANGNSVPLSSAKPPRPSVADGVGVNGLPDPPALVTDSPVPASRDPQWLPRKSRCSGAFLVDFESGFGFND